jgi:hypothetical protein
MTFDTSIVGITISLIFVLIAAWLFVRWKNKKVYNKWIIKPPRRSRKIRTRLHPMFERDYK